MTLKEAIDIALLKIEAERGDYESALYFYAADEAQKKIAFYGKHIEKTFVCEVTEENKEFKMPDDFYSFGSRGIVDLECPEKSIPHFWKSKNELVFKTFGTFTVNYFAKPETITPETPEEYVFEVDNDTHVAIPFYIASELAKSDDVELAQIALNQWNNYMSLFADSPTYRYVEIENAYPI